MSGTLVMYSFGKFVDYEFVDGEFTEEGLRVQKYRLLECNNWVDKPGLFTFYKERSKWYLVGVIFDTPSTLSLLLPY